MRKIPALFVFLALFAVSLRGQDEPAAAWQGIVHEQKALKVSIVLGAQLTEGTSGQVWEFQILDTNYKNNRRIVGWNKGQMTADRAGSMEAFDRGNLIPLGSANLGLSVAPIRAKVRGVLADAGKKPDSVQYALSRREGQEHPQWLVTCLRADQERLAEFSFSADKAQLLKVDLDPGKPHLKTVKKEAQSFGNDVERTFMGIGGDLEEFFTGKRTVDK